MDHILNNDELTRKGILIVSLDFELYWGVRDIYSLDQTRAKLLAARSAIPALLDLFVEYGVHATWATVGMLFAETREELVHFLAPYRKNALADHPWKSWAGSEATGHRMPGGQSRWSHGKDLSWEPLRPELVVEVAYEHMQGTRFRHTAQFRRWRTDKRPEDCTYAQLEVVPPQELMEIFSSGRAGS